jgi:2-desacetyl-2-hydroxyethyl bacteriochlorophyllide A dehydrogenase
MKALKLTAPGCMEIRDVPVPAPGPGDVTIKVAYAGLCGTDLHAYKGEYSKTRFPVVLGHELSGVVTEVGEDVTKLKAGDRVTCESTYKACEECRYCKSKDYNLCGTRIGIGTNKDGAFEEYMTMAEDRVWKLPDNVSLKAGAISEPLACGTHAVMEVAQVQPGDTVCVFGAGAIGLMVALVAVSAGATVILAGLTIDEERFAVAKDMGVQYTVDQQKEDLAALVLSITDGGVDHAFECSGAIPALHKAFEIVHKKGQVIQMGMYREDMNPISMEYLLHKEIRYMGSRSQKPSSWALAMDLFEKAGIHPEKAVSMIVPVERWQEAFDSAPGGKKLIVFDDFGEA